MSQCHIRGFATKNTKLATLRNLKSGKNADFLARKEMAHREALEAAKKIHKNPLKNKF